MLCIGVEQSAVLVHGRTTLADSPNAHLRPAEDLLSAWELGGLRYSARCTLSVGASVGC